MAESVFCGLCHKEFKSAVAMKNHICKESESRHELMAHVYNSDIKIKCGEINDYIVKYSEWFQRVNEINLEQTCVDFVDKIKEDIQKEKEEKEFQKAEERRQREYQKQLEQMQRLKDLEEERKLRKKVESAHFKQMDEKDRPKALLDEYYTLTGGYCYQYMIEMQLVKGLYTKHNFDSETAHFIIRYMAKMRIPLKNINYKLDDAMKFKKGLEDAKVEGTIPFLIKYFYQKTKQKRNNKLFVREIDRLESSQSSNDLTYEQLKRVLDGMIAKGEKNIAFFDTYVSQFAFKQAESADNDPVHNFTDEREVKENVKQIVLGNLTLDDVNFNIRQQCAAKLKQIYLQGKFNNNYNYFEWAYKAKLPLDKELYSFGMEHSEERNSRFKTWYLKAKMSGNAIMFEKYQKAKQKFDNWVASCKQNP